MASIHPYQWELLASMLAYKTSNGLCLEFERLGQDDLEHIYKQTHIPSKGTLFKWGTSRKPVDESLELLVQFISDIFPYKSLDDFISSEHDLEQFHKCSDWDKYLKYSRAHPDSHGHKIRQEIKTWSYSRVLSLVERDWSPLGFSGLHNQETLVKKFAGEYLIFKPGQIPRITFDDLYYDPLTIEKNGSSKYQNRYIQEWYHGNAIIKDKNALQMIFFSEKDKRKDGFEYVISVKINNYGVTAKHFAGICLSFTGNNNIYAYPILMTKDLSLTIEHPFVRAYFERCYKDYEQRSISGRMECQSPDLLLELEHQFYQKQ